MKRCVMALIAAVFLAAMAFPGEALAQGRDYVVLKGGVYWPAGDLDDSDFDSGFNGEIAAGIYYGRNLAIEFGVGYMQSEASISTATLTEDDKLWVIPATFSIKGVIPLEPLELYAGFGGGAYFVNVEADGTSTTAGAFSGDDDDVVMGGHVLAGLNLDIGDAFFVGVEGKYLLTGEAELFSSKTNIEGFTLTGNLGIRF